MVIGVVVVTFNACDIIEDCLESLIASTDAQLRIVVVDNNSSDDTIGVIRTWARDGVRDRARDVPFCRVSHGPIALVEGSIPKRSGSVGVFAGTENRGFAGGVNVGLKALAEDPEIKHFWILNPDCMAQNDTASSLLECARRSGKYGLIGGRIFYEHPRDMIQSDGGRINMWTGTCIPFNMTRRGRDVPAPAPEALDYVSGTHMFASRAFLERAGPMPEDYFLYYEEMEWCMRRGDLPLIPCPKAAVHHHGGHSIGSATINCGPSPMSAYFMARARMRFVARHRPAALPLAFLYAAAKAVRHVIRGEGATAVAMGRGLLNLPPSRSVRRRIGRQTLPGAHKFVFATHGNTALGKAAK